MYKIITFCQEDNVDAVIKAMASAGAGQIGNYSHCAFILKGEGNWLSEEGSNPTIGEVGKMTRAAECKVEMICSDEKVKEAIKALREAHSYEEPEIDLIKLYEL